MQHEIMRLRQNVCHPLLLTYIYANINLSWTFSLLEKMNGKSLQVEKVLGLASWDWILDREIVSSKGDFDDYNEPQEDFTLVRNRRAAAERYNVLSGKLILIQFRLHVFQETIIWMRRMNVKFAGKVQTTSQRKKCAELDNLLDRMDDFTKVYLQDADSLKVRLDQQLSNMSFLTTQRDSRVNLAIADINNELAWKSKNTNFLMLAIAVVSFLFLPGTFLASVFDAPICNTTDSGSLTFAKQPFWIFSLTLSLTMISLIVFWVLFVNMSVGRRKEQRREERRNFRNRILRQPTVSVKISEQEERNRTLRRQWSGIVKHHDNEEGLGVTKEGSFKKSI